MMGILYSQLAEIVLKFSKVVKRMNWNFWFWLILGVICLESIVTAIQKRTLGRERPRR